MGKAIKAFFAIVGVILLMMFFWYIRTVLTYVLIAVVLSLMGAPLVNLLGKIKLPKEKNIPIGLRAILSLGIMGTVLIGLFLIFAPTIIEQATVISQIDPMNLSKNLEVPLENLSSQLTEMGLISENESVQTVLVEHASDFLDVASLADMFKSILGQMGNIFIAIFAVLFISFFFLKDQGLVYNFIMNLCPEKNKKQLTNVLINAKNTLSRYFLGLVTQIVLVSTLVSLGLSIIDVKHAIVIGIFTGIVNVIPFIGPLIGAAFGILITITLNLNHDFHEMLLPLILKIIVVFGTIQMLDNFIFQPFIFSNSVNAHPLEIFLLIMIAGVIAGIPGMIVAVPVYSFLRIIAREFFSQFRIIRDFTKNMDT